MPRSVPDNELMDKQQAKDRKSASGPAKRRPRPKAQSKPDARSGPGATVRKKTAAKSSGKPADAASAKRKQAKTSKPRAAPAPAVASGEPLPPAPDAKRIEEDTRANRGLGGLLRRLRLSWGERKLKQAAQATSSRKK